MQKFIAHPVVAPFFLIFGLVLSQFGYAYLKRGSFQYTAEHGPTQIISPATHATVYWTVAGGMLTVGVLCLVISAYAALRLVRAYRTRGTR